ncbi:MAG: GGDEF domain-containing protein [Gammaproteobacteria bacterium]|nr:GGDEF domain-containing protein [Gammaproteobacteria bacterium]
MRSLAGLSILTLVSSFVGTRYLLGVFTSLALIIIVTGFTFRRGYPPSLLLDVAVFLIVGLTIAYSTGYTIDRQRRRLFGQVKLLAQERDNQEKLALHDALTGLPNRLLLRERMAQSLARAQRQHEQFAILFVDLDDFKTVNDSYGHAVGDDVLCQLADRRSERTRSRRGYGRPDRRVTNSSSLSERVSDEAAARCCRRSPLQAAISRPVIGRAEPEGRHDPCSRDLQYRHRPLPPGRGHAR